MSKAILIEMISLKIDNLQYKFDLVSHKRLFGELSDEEFKKLITEISIESMTWRDALKLVIMLKDLKLF